MKACIRVVSGLITAFVAFVVLVGLIIFDSALAKGDSASTLMIIVLTFCLISMYNLPPALDYTNRIEYIKMRRREQQFWKESNSERRDNDGA